MLKWVVPDRNGVVQVKCVYTILPPKNCVQAWYQMETNTQTNPCIQDASAGWYLPIMQNSDTSMEVGSVLHMCCIWVEQVGLDYPGMCCLLCLTWPSQMALSQQANCLQMTLELRYLYAQPLPCLPQSALSCGWWAMHGFYVGSGCAPPHLWGIPHRLVHQGRTTFPPHIPYSPIGSLFYSSPWRQLHRLEPCPPPPRWLPCLTCHSLVYGTVPLWPGMVQPIYGPIWLIPSVSVQILKQ